MYLPALTDANNKLVSSTIDISQVTGLGSVTTNPYGGTLEVSHLDTINDDVSDIGRPTERFKTCHVDVVRGDNCSIDLTDNSLVLNKSSNSEGSVRFVG